MTTSQAIGQLRLVLRRQHKALSTEQSYVFWLRRYMQALFRMPRHLSSEQKLERFPPGILPRSSGRNSL
jgi:hypothetical protein